jgi:hypothetical protein
VPDTNPAPSDQATAAGPSAHRALDAVQVALDRRDNGGEAATTGHAASTAQPQGKITSAGAPRRRNEAPAQPARKTRRNA